MIKLMEKSMLAGVKNLDALCFNKSEHRSIENLDVLLSNFPGGCFVLFVDNELIGYIFSKILGNVGFIGPLGVNPSYQKKGLGKQLITAGVNALIDSGCLSIGLEVLPELGNNIGLYLKSGFIPTFSTITYRKKLPCAVIKNDSVIDGKSIELNRIISFDNEFKKEHNGFSLLKDIELAISQKNSDIYFYSENNEIKGFLCLSPLIYPFIWGGLLNNSCHKDIFDMLFSKIGTADKGRELKIRINSRYKKALNLIDCTFEVERSNLRMMLKGFENEYITLDEQSFIAKSWIS